MAVSDVIVIVVVRPRQENAPVQHILESPSAPALKKEQRSLHGARSGEPGATTLPY
ncbi:hypothetical protein P3W85_19410 [Cupriavidus basilensis]|uniref:Uncharacterized protein n=1 Tax=Cupriavidus basilensis TaxID=68895 RepID=A0ABT6AR62_9BURK|nr:hypothetical protein [Cupriavidus basilensis]MDF3835111.1 hypothetical protein [Cupriavidus basilensis]